MLRFKKAGGLGDRAGVQEDVAMGDEALIWTDGPLGRIHLNRPRAINALTPAMIDIVRTALDDFTADPAIVAIAIDGAGERGLCSGADVRAIRAEILERGAEAAAAFWRNEYAMNSQISALQKPYAALMDGIVMGGGVGISTYGSIRVTTPRTRLAMPETGIGLFPDVGTMFTLSRAPGELGTHMALTGAPVSGGDAVLAGFADAVIDPDRWEDLLEALRTTPTDANAVDAARDRERALGAAGADEEPPGRMAGSEWIAECYASDDAAEIIERLTTHEDPEARAAGELIASRSPLSVAVTLAALRRAATLPDLDAVLEQDLRIAQKFTQDSDFLEGVRAVLVDKDNSPRWRHRHVREVESDFVESIING